LDPKPGDLIAILECKLRPRSPPLKLVQLGIDHSLLKRVTTGKDIIDAIEKADITKDSKLIIDGVPICDVSESIIIQAFFHEMFSRKVADSEPDPYKMTIAIAELWFENPDIAGITYPMIATRFLNTHHLIGNNVALRKEVADACYTPSRIWLNKCDSVRLKGYALEQIKYAQEVDSEGYINWSANVMGLDL
jgi:hypothetical protein